MGDLVVECRIPELDSGDGLTGLPELVEVEPADDVAGRARFLVRESGEIWRTGAEWNAPPQEPTPFRIADLILVDRAHPI